MTSAREQILSTLRAISYPVYELPALGGMDEDGDLISAFELGLRAVAGRAKRIRTLSEIQLDLDERMARGEQVYCNISGLNGNRGWDEDPHALGDLDFSVFAAEWGVAENGAVWVRERSAGHRVAPFITEHLGLVLRKDRLVRTMHAAIERITLEPGGMGVFIAGPSKTADIEQSLVIGAHGACSLIVYLL